MFVSQSCPTLATLWTVAHQAPLSMGFSRQECWSGLPFPSPGDLPYPGIKPGSPALAGGFFTIWATGETQRLLLVPVLGVKPGLPGWKPGILTTKPYAKETRFKYLFLIIHSMCGLGDGNQSLMKNTVSTIQVKTQWVRASYSSQSLFSTRDLQESKDFHPKSNCFQKWFVKKTN